MGVCVGGCLCQQLVSIATPWVLDNLILCFKLSYGDQMVPNYHPLFASGWLYCGRDTVRWYQAMTELAVQTVFDSPV